MKDLNFYLILIVIQCIFGMNYSASKLVITSFDATSWAIIRFLLSGMILFFFALLFRRKSWKWSWKYFSSANVLALVSVSLSQITFLKGLQITSTINASIICSLIPVLTIVLVLIYRDEPFSYKKVLGLIVSFVGVILMRDLGEITISNLTFRGDLLIFVCAITAALSMRLTKKFFMQHDSLWGTVWIFLFGTLQLGLFAIWDRPSFALPPFSPELLFSALFGIFAATIMTYFLSNYALKHIDASKVSLFIYLQPVIAIFIGVLFLNEVITLRMILASIMVFIGFIISLKKRKERNAH